MDRLVPQGSFLGVSRFDIGEDLLGIRVDGPEDGIELFLRPVFALLGLRRTDIKQYREANDLPQQLQEF